MLRHARPAATPLLAAIVLGVFLLLASCRDVAPEGQDDAATSIDVGADAGAVDGAGAASTTAVVTGAATGPRVGLEATVFEADAAVEIEVRVLLLDIPDLFGAASHLRFDPTALELIEAKEHAVLAGDGWAPRALVKGGKDRVLLGAARVREGGSPYSPLQGAKVGKQVWATLRFRVIGALPTTLAFDPARTLARSADYAPLALDWAAVEIRPAAGGAR